MANDRLIRRVAWTAIGLTLVACAATVTALASPTVRAWLDSTIGEAGGYAVGDQIDVPARVYAGRDATLVVFASSSCPACQSSKPLLMRLTAALPKDTGVALVMSSTHPDGSSEFARDAGVSPDHLFLIDLAPLRVKRVPLVVLVDARGRVRWAREGVLTEPVYEELRSRLEQAPVVGD